MNLIYKIRLRRFRKKARKRIRQGFTALLWMQKKQLMLGWSKGQRKAFWKDFVYSDQTREQCIAKGVEMAAPGMKVKK